MKHGLLHIGLSGVVFSYCSGVWSYFPTTMVKEGDEVTCLECLKIMKKPKKTTKSEVKQPTQDSKGEN